MKAINNKNSVYPLVTPFPQRIFFTRFPKTKTQLFRQKLAWQKNQSNAVLPSLSFIVLSALYKINRFVISLSLFLTASNNAVCPSV